MEVTFIGDPNDDFSGPAEVTVYGITFQKGDAVKVDGRTKDADKFRGHSHFEVIEESPKKAKQEKQEKEE